MNKKLELYEECYESIFGKEGEKIQVRPKEEQLITCIHEVGHYLVHKELKLDYYKTILLTIVAVEEKDGSVRYGANVIIEPIEIEKTERYYKDRITYFLGGYTATRITGKGATYSQADLIEIEKLLDEYVSIFHKDIKEQEVIEQIKTDIVQQAYLLSKYAILKNKKLLKKIVEALFIRKILLAKEIEDICSGNLRIEDLELIEGLYS